VGLRVGFININDMYNNDVGKGGAQGCEAYEVKQRVALVGVPFYFINLLPTSLLYISILLLAVEDCEASRMRFPIRMRAYCVLLPGC